MFSIVVIFGRQLFKDEYTIVYFKCISILILMADSKYFLKRKTFRDNLLSDQLL